MISLLAASSPAQAHPHVWVDYSAALTVADGRIDGLRLVLRLDSMYSAIVRSEVIMNDTEASLQQKTVQAAGADIFKDNPVYLHLIVDGQARALQPLALQAPASGDGRSRADGAYTVELKLPAPARTVSFTIYDPTSYVSVALQDEPGAISADAPASCSHTRVTVAETVWGLLRADKVDCSLPD